MVISIISAISNSRSPLSIVSGYIVGNALWSRIAAIAAKRFPLIRQSFQDIFFFDMVSVIGFYGGLIGAHLTNPVFRVLQIYALAMLALYMKFKKEKEDPPNFVVDMTLEALQEPERTFLGTEPYIGQLEIYLTRARKPNAMLIGPAGIGKTVIVEDLASRIAYRRLSSQSRLRDKKIFKVDIKALLTGGIDGGLIVGQVESRINKLLDFIKGKSCIVFIDEIHTIGLARGSSGGFKIADMLKEALARKGISLIGATTQMEYDTILASDAAFTRRFEEVRVIAPDLLTCLGMIQHQKPYFAREYPNTNLTDNAIRSAIFFAKRDYPERQLPDSAMDLIHNAHTMANIEVEEGNDITSIDMPQIARAHATKVRTHPDPLKRYTSDQLEDHFNILLERYPQYANLAVV